MWLPHAVDLERHDIFHERSSKILKIIRFTSGGSGGVPLFCTHKQETRIAWPGFDVARCAI